MSEKKKKISGKSILSCIVSLVVGIAGVLGAQTVFKNDTSNKNVNTNNNSNNQKQEQSITININGQDVEINKNNAQTIYGNLEAEKDKLSVTVDELNSELDDYKQYGKEALVSINPNYDSAKVSLFAFEPVNFNEWKKNEGSLKDSLGNEYDASMPYVVMQGDSYGEYYPNGKFQKLKFTVAANESMTIDETSTVTVMIDDDLTVLTIDNISRKTEPKSYTVDLKGAHFVKIICSNSSGTWYANRAKVMLLDATLIK